jgi:hypothetical protein
VRPQLAFERASCLDVLELATVHSKKLVLAVCAVAAAILVAHSLIWNFVTDDAFISFVYSRNLARHGQLVFNLGEHVEGYTNFLWTVLLAALMKVGLQPELMSRVLGTGAGCATLFVCARASARLRGEWRLWDALPALLLAGVPGFACWSSGGLETQLFTLLVTLGATLFLVEEEREHPPPWAAVCFGLAALTRPEGLLFFALTVAFALALTRRLPTRGQLIAFGVFVAMVAPHLLWRRWYYGWWLPNTFYIKSSGLGGAWSQGGYYLQQLTLQFHLWIVPLLMAGSLLVKRERRMLTLYAYATFVVAVFFVYVASVGGDFMGLFRFALPVLPLIALCAARALETLCTRLPSSASVPVVALALALHAWHAVRVDRGSFFIGADHGIDTPGYLRWYTADRAAIGKWFAQYARPDDYAAVGGAGAQVYYSGMKSLDCFGLSDEHIAHDVPPVSTRPGHQKYAPLDYQLAKKPTLITSAYYRIQSSPFVPPPSEEQTWRARLPLRQRAGARALVAVVRVPAAQRPQPRPAAQARRAGALNALPLCQPPQSIRQEPEC